MTSIDVFFYQQVYLSFLFFGLCVYLKEVNTEERDRESLYLVKKNEKKEEVKVGKEEDHDLI